MPAAKLQLDFKGMVTAPGQLAAPPGSMTTAQNVNFPAPGIAEKRKGFASAAYGFGGACWSVISSKQLGANLLFNVGTGTTGNNLQYGDGSAPRTAVSTPDGTTLANVATARMKGAVSLKNHYLTSARAPLRLESDYSLHFAGMPRSPGITNKFTGQPQLTAGSNQWLAAGYAVAYRVVWVTTDADGVELVSAPSGRWVIANIATTNGYTGAARSTNLGLKLPFQADTTAISITQTWKYRVYRSIATDVTVAQPNDEMQLCYEAAVTGVNIAAGEVTIVDSCPEAALGAYLYTNTISGGDVSTGLVRSGSTSLGLLAENDRPPLAKDVALFADCMWWANFTTLHRSTISILAVGAAGNVLKVGDVIEVDGVALTGVAGAPVGAQFVVETGLASTTLNIRATAMNLAACITSNVSTVVASYIGSDASPGTIGRILVEAIRSDSAGFNMSITSGSTLPYLPNMANGIVSTQDTWGNGIAISKPFQADACAPANYVRVGRNDTVIQRVIPLRDALFIFTDDGIYWARGNSPADFVIDSFDTTFRTLARDCVVACGDAIYAWGYEGIARITNGGVEYLDIPIRNFVQSAQRGLTAAVTLADFAQRAFAVAYRVERRVVFMFPSGNENGSYECCRGLVFHIATGAWSTYLIGQDDGNNGKLCGVVRVSDELLHFGEWSPGTDTRLYIERHKFDSSDFSDDDTAGHPIAISTSMTWTSCVPSPAGLCHWPEFQVYYSPSDVDSTLGLPGAVGVHIVAEHGGAQLSTITAPSTLQSRIMLSPAIGLAARLTVTVSHDAPGDYFSTSGFALLYHPVSNFIGR